MFFGEQISATLAKAWHFGTQMLLSSWVLKPSHIWRPGVNQRYKEKAVWLGKRSESCTTPFGEVFIFNLYQHDTTVWNIPLLSKVSCFFSRNPRLSTFRSLPYRILAPLGTRNEVAQCLSLVTCTWCHGPWSPEIFLLVCSWTDQILPLGKYSKNCL